jgi:2-C-methyl-D-erythritol 4-phosphate cytidylyltransferase
VELGGIPAPFPLIGDIVSSMKPCAIVPLPRTVDPATAFSPVGGQAPLVRVVRAVQTLVADARIVVATVPALASDASACLQEADLDSVAVTVAREGASRRQILVTGLEHLGVERNSSTPVLICDLRHPLSPGEVADRVIAALRDGRDVVVPTLPVTDTVKTVDELGSVLGTVDRGTLRTVQYPRGFTASALWDLVSSLVTADSDEFTTAMRAGLDIGTVDGDANGFQVELPRDAQLMAAIIACRPG